MKKVTSIDLSQGITIAMLNSAVQHALQKRDSDHNLDCVFISSKILSGVDAPVKVFEIIFNYDDIHGNKLIHEDVIVGVKLENGNYEITHLQYK